MSESKTDFLRRESQEFAEFLEGLLTNEARRLKLQNSEDLLSSIRVLAMASGAEGAEILVRFATHGRFRDMGAGSGYHKGKPISDGERQALVRGKARKPAKWYSKTAYGSLNTLIGNLSNKYVEQVVESAKKMEE